MTPNEAATAEAIHIGYWLLAIGYWLFIRQVRQFSPVTAGIDPDRAIAAECDDLSGRQRCDLFDFPDFISSRGVRWGHAGSLRMTDDKSQEFEAAPASLREALRAGVPGVQEFVICSATRAITAR
jgi:hypothetical protein